MRTQERRWHLRMWLVLGPACMAAIALAIWSRPPEPRADGWPRGIGHAVQAEGGEPAEGSP